MESGEQMQTAVQRDEVGERAIDRLEKGAEFVALNGLIGDALELFAHSGLEDGHTLRERPVHLVHVDFATRRQTGGHNE